MTQLQLLHNSVFSNVFFEADPLAAIWFARGNHEHSQRFVSGGTVNFEAEVRERGRGSWRGGSKLVGLGSAVSSPSGI